MVRVGKVQKQWKGIGIIWKDWRIGLDDRKEFGRFDGSADGL